MQCCHWPHHLHHVMPALTPVTPFDLREPCCTFWLSWPNECNVVTCDTIGIMWCQHWHQLHNMTKSHVAPYFDFLKLSNVWCHWQSYWLHVTDTDTAANCVNWPKHLLDLRNAWCHWQHHQNHMMQVPLASHDKKAMLYPISIILT